MSQVDCVLLSVLSLQILIIAPFFGRFIGMTYSTNLEEPFEDILKSVVGYASHWTLSRSTL